MPADLTSAELEALKADDASVREFDMRLHEDTIEHHADPDAPRGYRDWHDLAECATGKGAPIFNLLSAAPRLIAMAERLARLEPLLATWGRAQDGYHRNTDTHHIARLERIADADTALLAALRGAR
jgi:hypothetical protein